MKPTLATVGLFCVASLASCHRPYALKEPRAPLLTLSIGSSDTLSQLTAAWAEVYDGSHSNVAVTAGGGGSGTAIAGLLNGSVHVAATIRKLNEAEEARFVATHGRLPKRTLIGYEAAAVCVHKDNPVTSVSLEDLAEIFAYRGRIDDWSDLGPNDSGPVRGLERMGAISRGTIFYQTVFTTDSRDIGRLSFVSGSHEIVETCASDRRAIGYVGLGWTMTDKVKWLSVARERGGGPVEPSGATIRSGRYPIARPLFFYLLDEASVEVEAFVALALNPEGQRILKREGFVTVTE